MRWGILYFTLPDQNRHYKYFLTSESSWNLTYQPKDFNNNLWSIMLMIVNCQHYQSEMDSIGSDGNALWSGGNLHKICRWKLFFLLIIIYEWLFSFEFISCNRSDYLCNWCCNQLTLKQSFLYELAFEIWSLPQSYFHFS